MVSYRTTLFRAAGVFFAIYVAIALWYALATDIPFFTDGGIFVVIFLMAGFTSGILFSLFAITRLSREPRGVAVLLFGISAVLSAPLTLVVLFIYRYDVQTPWWLFPLITGAQIIAAFVLFWKNQPQQAREAA